MEAILTIGILIAAGVYVAFKNGKRVGSRQGFGAALRKRSSRRWRR